MVLIIPKSVRRINKERNKKKSFPFGTIPFARFYNSLKGGFTVARPIESFLSGNVARKRSGRRHRNEGKNRFR